MKKLAVITINYNTPDMTEKAIRNFLVMEKELDNEILAIDNDSQAKINPERLNSIGVKIIYNTQNYGFAKAINQGIKNTDSEYILLLNSDVLIEADAISKLIAYLEEHKHVGVIGPQMIFPDGRFQSSFGFYPTILSEFLRFSHLYEFLPGSTFTFNTKIKPVEKERPQAVDWVTGGCMLIQRRLIEEIGLFDEHYFLGVEDIDFCYRARQTGWQVVFYPLAKVVHYHGFSSGGTRSVFRIVQDRNGIDYFLKKFYPQKKISRFMVRLFHNIKILVFKLPTNLQILYKFTNTKKK